MAAIVRNQLQRVLETGRPSGWANSLDHSFDFSQAYLTDAISIRGYGGGVTSSVYDPGIANFHSFIWWEDVTLDSFVGIGGKEGFRFGDVAQINDTDTLVTWWKGAGSLHGGSAVVRTMGSPGFASATILGTGSPFASATLGPCVVTSSTTAYALVSDATGLRIAKTTALDLSFFAWSTKLVSATLGWVSGGLCRVGSTLVVLAYDVTAKLAKVLTSTDDGTTWVTGATLPDSGHMLGGTFLVGPTLSPRACFYSSTFWVVGYYNDASSLVKLARTTDGGATWTTIAVSPAASCSGVAPYVVHSSHFLMQWTIGLMRGDTLVEGAVGAPQYAETTNAGADWTTPVATPFPLPPDTFFRQGKLTHGLEASGGLDGGVPGVSSPHYPFPDASGHDLISTVSVGTSTPSGNGIAAGTGYGGVAGWQLDDRVSPDSGPGASSTAAHGPSESIVAVFTDGFFTEGSSETLLLEYLPTRAEGPSETLTVLYHPIANQTGYADILNTTDRDQLGFAVVVFQRDKDQAGFAFLLRIPDQDQVGFAFINHGATSSQDQAGFAFITPAPPPAPRLPVRGLRVRRMDDGGWQFTWDAGTRPYEAWLDGVQLASGLAAESYVFRTTGYDFAPPDLEVLDSSVLGPAQNEVYPPFLILQWRGLQSAAAYIVEQFLESAWTPAGFRREDASGYYQWQSQPLVDDQVYLFRVSACDVDGSAGVPIDFTFRVVRNPLHPSVAIGVSSSGNVVVSPGGG